MHKTIIGDKEIRIALKDLLEKQYKNTPNTLILDELGLGHGHVRVDVAVINGALHGYELKSDKDTLFRLPEQSRAYSLVFDQITLITGKRHIFGAIKIIPDWWGIKIAAMGPRGRVRFHVIRQASANPTPSPIAILELLWKEEALNFLGELDSAKGFRSKKRSEIYNRIVEIGSLKAIKSKVRNQLRSRPTWRSE